MSSRASARSRTVDLGALDRHLDHERLQPREVGMPRRRVQQHLLVRQALGPHELDEAQGHVLGVQRFGPQLGLELAQVPFMLGMQHRLQTEPPLTHHHGQRLPATREVGHAGNCHRALQKLGNRTSWHR
jgi:hypothetical protein